MKRSCLFIGCLVGVELLGMEDALVHPQGAGRNLSEEIVLTEAAGEPMECKIGVAEVLRNRRWDPRGFAGIQRTDLQRFLQSQPTRAHQEAKKAVEKARNGSDLTHQATHFENIEAFGVPPWARSMEKTTRLGQLTFFKERAPKEKSTSHRRA